MAKDRVLLHAERCLTYINENPGPWPTFVPTRAHHCLLGCLLCQRSCPANSKLPIESTGVAFSREETEALLADTGTTSRPSGIECARSSHGSASRTRSRWWGETYGRSSKPRVSRPSRALEVRLSPRGSSGEHSVREGDGATAHDGKEGRPVRRGPDTGGLRVRAHWRSAVPRPREHARQPKGGHAPGAPCGLRGPRGLGPPGGCRP